MWRVSVAAFSGKGNPLFSHSFPLEEQQDRNKSKVMATLFEIMVVVKLIED